jgi:hypothetical protein
VYRHRNTGTEKSTVYQERVPGESFTRREFTRREFTRREFPSGENPGGGGWKDRKGTVCERSTEKVGCTRR